MYGAAKKKAVKLDKLKNEYALLDDAYAQTQEEKVDLQEAVQSELTSKLVQCENSQFDHDFTFQTKSGRRYSPAIRKLYYTLLAEEVSSAKIAGIIKTVLRCMFPAIDVESLQLPKRACAKG